MGQSIRLNDKSYTVVGIMPESFRFRVITNLVANGARCAKEQQGDFVTLVEAIGRLKPGVPVERAQSI